MTKPWQTMKSIEAKGLCEDCEVVPSELWCDSCGVGLCRECDLQCHDPRGFACSHRRIFIVSQSPRVKDDFSGSSGSEFKNASLNNKAGGVGGIEFEEVEVNDPSHAVPISPSKGHRRKQKKHVKVTEQIPCQLHSAGQQQVDQPSTGPASPFLSRSATFPTSGTKKISFQGTTAQSSGTEHEDSSTSDECPLYSSNKTGKVTRSTSLPSSFKPKSALRGSHEDEGLGARPKLHVQWAPDVLEPISSMMSHTVGHRQQSLRKKDQKHRRKGKHTQAHLSGKPEKGRKRKGKKDVEVKQLREQPFLATHMSSKGSGWPGLVPAVHEDSGSDESFTPGKNTSEEESIPASGLSSSSNSESSFQEERQLSEEDGKSKPDGSTLQMPLQGSQKAEAFSICTPKLESEEQISVKNSSLQKNGKHPMAEVALKSLQSLCQRSVIPAGLICSEGSLVSTYSEKAAACMVHAACMFGEEDTSGALVEFEASARLFRLAEKTARMETTAESETVAKDALKGQVMAWVAMANLYAKSGQFDRAEKCHLSLLQACQGSEMKLEAGLCLLDEGASQLKKGEFKRAQALFEAASALLEGELQATLEQQDECEKERSCYSAQLRETLVKAGRLAGVAALRSSDVDAAKRLLLGTLVVARRLHLKAEEARCLRLLAELQKGSQHLSSLQAAANAMSLINLPYEHAEALFCLGSCKVSLHLNSLHSSSQSPRDRGLLESAKCDLEEAVTLLQSPIRDGYDSYGEGECLSVLPPQGTTCSQRLTLGSGDQHYMDPAGFILSGRLFEALGRTCVLMGEFLEARTYFSLALRNKEWAAAFEDAAKQVETLLDTLHWEDSRTCRSSWSSVGTSIATGV